MTPQTPQQPLTTMHSGATVVANGHVVRGSKTRYGTWQRWGRRHYAQAAIVAIYPAALPKNVNLSQLTREVNNSLMQNPEWCAGHGRKGELSRPTVFRAWKLLLKS
jgi:hypothetical protein